MNLTQEKNTFIPRVYLATSDTTLINKTLGYINKEFKTISINLPNNNSITIEVKDITTPQFEGDALVIAIKSDNKNGTGLIKVYNKDTKDNTEYKIVEVINTLRTQGFVEVENPHKLSDADKMAMINDLKVE